MMKLFLSAFAVSLTLLTTSLLAQNEELDDFLGLESNLAPKLQALPSSELKPVPNPNIKSELLPELKGFQRFTGPQFHENESWRVSKDSVIQDIAEPNKGQKYSIIPWGAFSPEDWLSFEKWETERKIKDSTPDWKTRLRLTEHKELLGKMLQCRGTCSIYRGAEMVKGQHLSRIQEGDELITDKDSVAWVYVMDGSLLRLSSNSSISLYEINLSSEEILVVARLNQGHVYWSPRFHDEFPLDLNPETDSHSLPLMVKEANVQFFERNIFQGQSDQLRLQETLALDENAMKAQFSRLNEMKKENNQSHKMRTRLVLITPNSTYVANGLAFDAIYLVGGPSYFKHRGLTEGRDFSIQLRGYVNSETFNVEENSWYEVESSGKAYQKLTDAHGILQIIELLTKRVKSIELAREVWFKEFSKPLLDAIQDPRKLAVDHGYTLWGQELLKRIDFILEYSRRVETTHLRSIENLLDRIESKGIKGRQELSDEPYRKSLNHYLLGLKSRYDRKNLRVREMSDLQYYVWILKDGKL